MLIGVTAWSPAPPARVTGPTEWSRLVRPLVGGDRRCLVGIRSSPAGSSPPWPVVTAGTRWPVASASDASVRRSNRSASTALAVVVRAAARPADRRARHRRHDRGDGADVPRADPSGGRAPGYAALPAKSGQRDPRVRRRARRPVRRSRRLGVVVGDVAFVAHQRAARRAGRTIRDRVAMRLRVEADRAGQRSEARFIIAFSAVAIAGVAHLRSRLGVSRCLRRRIRPARLRTRRHAVSPSVGGG